MNNDCKDSAGGFQRPALRTPLYIAIAAAACLFANNWALAGPGGGKVTGGKGSIARAGATTNVHQQTERMSVQWQSFDLGRKETVNFLQPGSSSLVLNHIMQNGPSQIDGRINANGHVLLINPRGVIFGENSVINVGALTASTLWMQKDDFLNGDMVLRALDNEKGVVINSGLINAASGGVTLLGEGVSNEGLITAELGYVNLASGREAYLTFDEEGFLGVKVSADVVENLLGEQSSVSNSGEINAAGGKVVLQASVSSGLFDSAVNNSGIIAATGFDDVPGGSVHLLGDTVAVTGSAQISADGPAGGGEILVGGGFQGKDPQLTNSQITYVSGEASLNADATVDGDGGEVIVWADNTTRFHGEISARGGADGGDGGFVEVSGKQYLDYAGSVDTTAAAGATGMLLLDPVDIVIKAGSPSTGDDDSFAGDPSGTVGAVLGDDVGPTDIYETQLEGISATTNITLQATNDITVEDLTVGDGDGALNLQQTAMTSVTFQADADDMEGGDFIMDGLGNSIITNGGSVSISGANITVGNINAGSGNITLNATSDITAAGTYTGADGNFTFGQGESGTLDLSEAAFIFTTASATGGDGGNDTLVGDGLGVTLTGPNTFQTDSQMVNVEGVEIVTATGDLTGTTNAESYTLTGANVTVDTQDGSSFNDVVSLNGGGGVDSINAQGLGVSLSESDFMVNASSIAIENISSVDNVGTLTGNAISETYSLDGTTATVDTQMGSNFNGVARLNGGGGGDSINAQDLGVSLSESDFMVNASSIAIENISSVDNVGTLTGNAISETYSLDGTTATVDTQGGISFLDVNELVGGVGPDTLNNMMANVTLSDNGFTTGGGVAVSDVESVTATGDLTGTEPSKVFAFFDDSGVAVTSPQPLISFDNVDKLDGGGGSINAQGLGVSLSESDFMVNGSSIAIENISSVDNVGTLTGNAISETYSLDGTMATIDTQVGTSFNGVDSLNGGDGLDTLNNMVANVILSINGFNTGGDVAVSGVETVTATGDLTGTAASEVFAFFDDSGVTVTSPLTVISFDNVDKLDGGGGDLIDAQSNGVSLTQSDFTIARSSILIRNISSVDNVSTLTGDSSTENYTLAGKTVTVDTQMGSNFNDVDSLNGGDDFDTLNNMMANAILSVSGFTTGDGVAVSDVETVIATGELTGTDASEDFIFLDNNGVAVNSTRPGISFYDVVTLDGGGGENDRISAELRGVSLSESDFMVTGSDILITNISRVIEVGTLTGHSSNENYALTEKTATVDTQVGSNFHGVNKLLGGDGLDTLNNVMADVTLSDNGFTTGGGVAVSDVESVKATGDLTGTDNPDTFEVLGGSVVVVSLIPETTFFDVSLLNGAAGEDIFDLSAGDTVIGAIIGGADSDTLVNDRMGVTLTGSGAFEIDSQPVSVRLVEIVEETGSLTGSTNAEDFTFFDSNGVKVISPRPMISFSAVDTLDGGGGEDRIDAQEDGVILSKSDFMVSRSEVVIENISTVYQVGELAGHSSAEEYVLTGKTATVNTQNNFGTSFLGVETLDGGTGADKLITDGMGITLTGPGTFETNASVVVKSVEEVTNTGELTGTKGSETFELLGATGIKVISPEPEISFYDVNSLDGGGGSADLIDVRNSGVTLLGSTFIVTGSSIPIENIFNVDRVGTLKGDSIKENYTLNVTSVTVDTQGKSRFNDVSELQGGGDFDTLNNMNAGVTLLGNGFKTGGGVTVSQIESVLSTGNLTGSAANEVFTLTGGEVSVVPTGESTSFSDVNNLDGGPGDDTLNGASEYLLTAENAGQTGGRQFSGMENLRGTQGNDTFSSAGGSLTGTIDGLGQSGGEGDRLIGFANYALDSTGPDTADGTVFIDIESLTGTSANDDVLAGVNVGVLTELDGGTANEYIFHAIENIVGTSQSDSFTRSAGSLSGSIDGGDGDDILDGFSTFVLTALNMGTADDTRFSAIENLRGTAGNDSFRKANSNGRLTGLIQGGDEIPNSVGDRLLDFTEYQILGAGAGIADGTAYQGIESISATGNGNLLGSAEDNEFVLTGNNSGTIDGIAFSGFTNLAGLGGNDVFRLEDGGNLDGSINGGGGEQDLLTGFSLYELTGQDAGTANDIVFSAIENLQGTSGNDTFVNGGGNLTGVLNGLGQVAGTEGDQLIDFSRYDLGPQELHTANGVRFRGIESLTGTSGGDDLLTGGSAFVINGTNSGTVNGSMSFRKIENLEGTAGADDFAINSGSVAMLNGLGGDDTFVLNGGVVRGLVLGGDGFDEISGANHYVLTGDNKGTASQQNAGGTSQNSSRFEQVEGLVGTDGSDTFDLAGYTLSGRIDGLRDPETDGANGVTDQVIIVQDQDSATDIGFELTGDGTRAGDGKGYIRFGAVDGNFPDAGIEQFQLQYAGIEDFILTLEQDLNIRGMGTIRSSADIDIKGSLNMYGPARSAETPLKLAADQNITIRGNLDLLGQSIIDVSTAGTVLTIGGGVSLDTGNGAEIDGFVSVNITEEPIIQVEIEEITSLSIFSEIDIFASGRSSVASSASERLGSEDDFIEALRVATP